MALIMNGKKKEQPRAEQLSMQNEMMKHLRDAAQAIILQIISLCNSLCNRSSCEML